MGEFKTFPKPRRREKKPYQGMKRSYMKRVSDDRSDEQKAYHSEVQRWLLIHPWCEAGVVCGGKQPSAHIHHKGGRNDERLLDKKEWLAVCDDCHSWIHSNPEQAYENGFLNKKNERNESG